MTNATKKRLLDALLACRAIRSFTAGIDFAAYEASLLIRSAVERQFEIIGEALGQADKADTTLGARLPEIRSIVGLRNRLIHGYDSVDDQIVWDIVQTKLPGLEASVAALLDAEAGDANGPAD
jgi:uncharacterized protein with HEPN domain